MNSSSVTFTKDVHFEEHENLEPQIANESDNSSTFVKNYLKSINVLINDDDIPPSMTRVIESLLSEVHFHNMKTCEKIHYIVHKSFRKLAGSNKPLW
jgi:hypothetical protein